MRCGRVEEASAIAKRVRCVITRRNSVLLRNNDTRRNVRETWAKVREVTRGHRRVDEPTASDLTADTLNKHYAAISTDANYILTRRKHTVADTGEYVTEENVFNMLDRLKPTATGLDGLPAWFLKVSAPVLSAPLAALFNQSIVSGVVPQQWKTAVITPVAKVPIPIIESDYRPISITPVLSRLIERRIVTTFVYPALDYPPPDLNFSDQYAFRPTGSTTAAIVALLHTICSMLSTNSYVRVFAIDFSKAFDSIRHHKLLDKMSSLQIPDQIFNWMENFFSGRAHCTRFHDELSPTATISASVVQGSSIGPAAYVVTASDMRPQNNGNVIIKSADDTYLVVPAANNHTCTDELHYIQAWASDNNLRLNTAKSREITFRAHSVRAKSEPLPPPCLDIKQVTQLTALGVIINDRLTASDHVTELLTSCSRLLYALRVLKARGLPQQSLQDIFRATVEAKLTYAAPAWSGFCSAGDRVRLNAFLRRCTKLGYRDRGALDIDTLFTDCDERFFDKIKYNNSHILQQFLPDRLTVNYNLRTRSRLSCVCQLYNKEYMIR